MSHTIGVVTAKMVPRSIGWVIDAPLEIGMIRRASDCVEVEAVFAHGVFTPSTPIALHEGQRVVLSIEPVSDVTGGDSGALQGWQSVFEGLSDGDLSEMEPLILDRSRFFPERTNGA